MDNPSSTSKSSRPSWRRWLLALLLLGLLTEGVRECFFTEEKMPDLHIAPSKIKDGLFIDSFPLRVCLPKNYRTRIFYCIPIDESTGKPYPEASNLIFYAPFNGEGIKMKRDGLPDKLALLSRQTHFTVFTMQIMAGQEVIGKRKQYYIYPEAGWFDLVFRVKAHLEKCFGLENRLLYASGESAGGSMLEQMLVAYPERFAAIEWNGGSKYDFNLPEKVSARILMFSTHGCYGTLPSSDLYLKAKEMGYDIRYVLVRATVMRPEGYIDNHNPAPCIASQIALFLAKEEEFAEQWEEFCKKETVKNYFLQQ